METVVRKGNGKGRESQMKGMKKVMEDYREKIGNYLDLEIRLMKSVDVDVINEVMNQLEQARKRGNRVYICGNGGSGSTASHFVCDFNKGVSLEQEQKYQFVCLNDNLPQMMAIANDIGYDQIFKIPLVNVISPGDLFIGISGSGNSENVVLAAEYAKERNATVIGLTGYDGGKLKKIADYSLHVPVSNMQIVEDLHLMLDHLMMWVLAEK